MPALETLSKLVVLPNEYKERMVTGYFCPDLHSQIPDSEKPLIYVTHPDNWEDELWAPPPREPSVHTADEEADCFCSETESEARSSIDIEEHVEDVTVLQNEMTSDTTELWFYRTGWQNRGVYSSDDRSQMMYYADIPWRGWGTSLTIRRGGQNGEIVADSCRAGPGSPFEITFPDAHQHQFLPNGNKLILVFGCIYGRSHKFTYRNRHLAWKNGLLHRRLVDIDTEEVIAEFSLKPLSIHKDGKIVIIGQYAEDSRWVDVIVTTALTCQQREREIRRREINSG